jgi:serine/threonine protein kinase
MDVTIGQLIDSKYRIVRLLGQGGMGAVYEGENVRIHHRVAIKVLHAGIATNSDAIERFEREAQAAGKIGSDHIVEVFDLGELQNSARYMVMEYLEGENLSQRIQRHGRMPPEAIAPIMMQLLEGLGAAHTAGIVHRDLKPDNVFLVRSKSGVDFVKIVDFGVSKFNKLSGDSAMSMTRTGAVIGTPYYMSPEQAKGAKTTDHRSDLYSVGVVLYECATGQVPFQADTFNELMFKIVLETPPDPETLVQGLDPRFAAIIRKAMAREADARFQSAAEFQAAISGWLHVRGPLPSGAFAPMHGQAAGHLGGQMPFSASAPNAPNASSAFGVTPTVPAPPHPVLSQTNGSLPNIAPPVSSTQSPLTKGAKGSGAILVAVALALILVVIGGGVAAVKLVKGKSTASNALTTATTAVLPPPEPPPMPPAVAATTTASAPSVTATATSSASARATTTAPVATAPAPTSTARSGSRAAAGTAKPATSAPAAAGTVQVKGRTIRTDL